MIKLFIAVGSTASFAMDTLQAHISVIAKEGKDPTSCGSYGPISLINLDLKLFTKILANSLKSFWIWSIWIKWALFLHVKLEIIPLRFSILHVANRSHTQCVFLNTDAEKAFGRVNWNFMLSVLRYAGFDTNVLQWNSSIYSGPSAWVRANGVVSVTFKITKGARQGCPLSPLLFARHWSPFYAP